MVMGGFIRPAWSCWVLPLVWISTSFAADPYGNQPKLMTENGHLYIIAAGDKNLTFRTSGNGFVNLNGDNLLNIALMARRASNVVERFEQNIVSNIENRLKSLDRQISGPQGLTSKMAVLEQTVSNGNISGGPTPVVQRLALPARLNRITTRLRSVEVQVRNLRNLLTIDECLSNPCRNGGTCQDLFNGFVCTCPSNWQGTLCDEDVNECIENAGSEWGCKNGATCVNKPGSYECLCADTFFGLHCSLRTNDCSVANSARLCGNGICVNQGGNGRGYVCICNEGWTTDLSHSCTVDIDECQSKRYPCSHDPFVQCINLPGTYHCGFCPPGYTGNGFQCSDIDECAINNGGCSIVPKVSCRNTRGSRACGRCPPGFAGDGVICSPVLGGSCAINNGNCYPTAQCFQNAGIVSCSCPEGHVGNGYGPTGCSPTALLPNLCYPNPCKSGGTCVVVNNVARCVCHPHLTGPDCSFVVYASCSPNPCQNNGNCSVQTNQGLAQVMCTCPSGFEGSFCERISSDCGGMFYQDSGELQVPSGNTFQRYEGGQTCTWRIQVSSSKVVKATFDHIVLDPDADCAQNYIKLSDPLGSDGGYKEFCTSVNNREVLMKTSTNVLFVKFKAATGIIQNNFKMHWSAADADCGGEINIETHGTVVSPSFPFQYPPNLRCEWKLMAQPGKKIQLLFDTLDLELSPNCGKDYLKIQEYEDDEPRSVLAEFCNSSNPSPVTTHLPAAYLLFHTDSSGSGKGFKVTYTILDGCGGVLTSPTGIISPPMGHNGKYGGDLDCEWRIQLPIGDKIKINFNSFDLEDREECDDYLEVRDGPTAKSPVVGRWCGSSLPPSYVSSANTLTVIFHSDFIFAGSGFTLQYETVCGGMFTELTGEIKSPNYPLPYYAERECVFVITSPPNTAIRLQFRDFELEHLGPDCDFDFVEIRDGDNNNASVIGRYCGIELPPPVISSFNYLHVLFTSDATFQHRGFIANYSTIDIPCGGILKETTGVLSSPQTDEGYLPNAQCMWLISAPAGWAIQLSWLSFHLEFSRNCQMDAVEVYENRTTSNEGTLIDKYCGLKVPPSTTSTTNMMTIKFRSDDSVHREGFTAHYIMIDTRKVCGGTYRSISGHIESPNYPNKYSDNKECIWIIHVSQGQQIKLTFEDFLIEGDREACNYDSLEIRNGLSETSPLIGKYCGSTKPPDVTSLTNGLWVHFSSDRSSAMKGFRATWDAASTGCGGTLTGPSGTITSPNYPQPYARFAQCFFRISISHGSQVRLTFVDLDLEPNPRCTMDYIEVFDGSDDRSKSLGRFCSVNHPANILASSNNMFLKFVSDISFSGRGFHLKYHSECNITLKSHYGVLESPNYPQKYLPNYNCMWMIQAPRGNKLNISFVHFDLEDSARPFSVTPKDHRDCRYDYLEISEGTKNQTPSNTLGRFCGSDTPQTLSSQLDQVYVHLVTDHMLERTGYRLEWAVSGCGGVYNEKPRGTITSPNYPNRYPHEVECEWLITAPWDKSIEITVTDLQMEDMGKCSFDYLAIYGGEDDTAPMLMKGCHRQTSPITFTTSGNHAFIRFMSDYAISGKGFSASWKFVNSKCGGKFTSLWGVIHSHNYPKNYENNDDCEWLIKVPGNHLINLTFTDFDVETSPSDMVTDYVNVYDGDSVNAPLLLSHNGNQLPDPRFVISTNNTLLVRHKADGSLTAKGFSAQYAISCGARIIAKGSGSFALEDSIGSASPHAIEENANCTWYLSAEDPADKIMLYFTYFDMSPNHENKESMCSYSYVAVHDGDNVNATILQRICGTESPAPLRSSGSALTVQAVSQIDRSYHLGRFTALYSTYSTACGGEMTSEQGFIASPNYPDGYPGDVDCEWQIKASVGNKVTLSFIKFELEESEFCNADHLEVRSDASNGTLQGVFCGDDVPDNITAANALWLRFRSDSINTAKGFMAAYSLVHGVDLQGDSGQLASPHYPRPFVQSGQYKWTISVASNKVIRLTFSAFYTDKYQEDYCTVYLQIYDGPSAEESPSLLQACGAGLPSPVVSTSNVVTLVLQNEPWILGSYFLLSWQAVPPQTAVTTLNTTIEENNLGCGKVIQVSSTAENNSVTITSPGYPKNYDADLECTWMLVTTKGFHLRIQFTALNLEQFDDCDADFVKVYTESSTEMSGWMPLTPNLCYPNSTKLQLDGGNRMKMYFETDSSDEKSGFSATVTSVCGDTLTEPSGEIDTSLIGVNFTIGRVICEWEVRVKSGRTIQFSFDKFNLPKLGEEACVNSYIMFRNGGYKDSPTLGDGKYCGRIAPIIPQTTSNRAFISYSAMATVPGVLLRYQEVDFACKNVISLDILSNETISSPNYPQPPSAPHIACTWLVSAPAGHSIHLDFVSRFDLKFSQGCTVEYVEVRNGGTEISPLIGRYCHRTPPPIISQGSHMYIKYFTDADIPNNGFKAVVKIATCGGTYFDNLKVNILSPLYPERYPPNLDCQWRIVGFSMDVQLWFNVSDLFLSDDSNEVCENAKDYIEIINVNPAVQNVSDGRTTRLCGQSAQGANSSALVPPSISNEVLIRFHSSSQQRIEPRKRFAITISAKRSSCHHDIIAPSGIISSPGYPNPNPRSTTLKCSWTITVPRGRLVSIKFLDYDLEPVREGSPWSENKLSFHGAMMTYITTLSAKKSFTDKTIDSNSNFVRILYWEESVSGSHRGFKAQFSSDKPQVCGGVLNENGTVEFSPMDLNLTTFLCEWTRTQDFTAASNQTTFTVVLDGTLNNKTSEVCSLTDPSIIVHNKIGEVDTVLANLCENVLKSVTIRNPYPQITVLARKRASYLKRNQTITSSVARLSISYKTDQCGGMVDGPEAVITSPGFPGQYPAGVDCAWLINFQPNTRIQVKFEVLDLDVDCTKEFLTLYNGNTQTKPHLTAPLCGKSLPSKMLTQDHQMLVEFHSAAAIPNPSSSRRGFKLTVSQDASGCGGEIHLLTGEIQSPNYGSRDYPNNTECDWTIYLPPGFHAGLSFLGRFSLETSKNCSNDFIQIFDWQNDKWEQIGSNICGRTPPVDIKTTNNQFRVLFRTNSLITSDGFKLFWTNLCGAEIQVTHDGSIISPQFPKVYAKNLHCNYTVIAPGKMIYGEFEAFDVEESSLGDGHRCKFDNVTLKTYPREPWIHHRLSVLLTPVETILCGSEIPEPVYSYGKLNLLFRTDAYLEHKGFLFKYSLARCGGNITSPTVITNPNNKNFRNCTWYITAPEDKVVILKIQKLTGSFRSCSLNGIQLFEGHNISNSSSEIDSICSLQFRWSSYSLQKTRYVSSGNKMAILYYSNTPFSMTFQAAIGFTYGVKQKCGGVLQLADLTTPYVLTAPDVDGDGKYEPFLSCGWLLLAPQSHQIRLVFDRLDVHNCSTANLCDCDYLEIRDGDSDTSPLIDRYCGSSTPPSIVSSTGKLFIHFSSDGDTQLFGFQLTLTTLLSPCGLTVRNATTEAQVLHSPGYPHHNTDNRLNCLWTIITPSRSSNGVLSLHLTDLDLASPCTNNYLEIIEKYWLSTSLNTFLQSQASGSPTKLCGNRTIDMTTPSRGLQLRYVTSGATTHRGFSLEYKIKGCSGNYTTPYGRLVTNYLIPDTTQCHVTIQVPQPNATISLYFNHFMCSGNGKMIVYDGLTEQDLEIASFCAVFRPNPIFSTGPALHIKFGNFGRIAKYDITYSSTDQGRGCGGTYKDLTGRFSSPLYPSEYKKDSACRWDVSVPHGYKIVFSFLYFDIGPSHTCSSNYIEFFDVSTSTNTETIHSKYCGSDKPAQIQMNGDTAFVRYVTTTHNNGTGWILKWSEKSIN